MSINLTNDLHEDFIVSLLHSRMNLLLKTIHYVEAGNPINGYVQENLKEVERDLRWVVKKLYFDN